MNSLNCGFASYRFFVYPWFKQAFYGERKPRKLLCDFSARR